MNIHNMTKRQFDAAIRKEGMSVSDYYDSTKTYTVFFRRNNRSSSPQGKLRMYYAQNTDISVGTVFVLKGTTYLVISQDALESNIFFTSLAIRCDTNFTVYSNREQKYVVIPFATISDKYTVSYGNTINIINGSVVIYTGLNDYVKEMEINSEYYNYGGFYKVGNYFYNDNLAYVYLSREANKQDTYSLIYNGSDSPNLSVGTYQLSYTAIKNGTVVNNPPLTYNVSDETVATVSATGLLTMLKSGSVSITAIWTDGANTTCSTSISIVSEDIPPVTTGTTVISGNTNLKNGYSRTYSAIFYDSSENAVDGITAVWSITNCNFENEIQQTVLDGNKFKIQVDNENFIGETFTLNAADTDGNFTIATITVHIVE